MNDIICKNKNAKLLNTMFELGLLEEVKCNQEETETCMQLTRDKKSLPEGIYSRKSDTYDEFYYCRYVPTNLDGLNVEEYLQIKQTKMIHSINKFALFFVVLTSISLVFSLIATLATLFN